MKVTVLAAYTPGMKSDDGSIWKTAFPLLLAIPAALGVLALRTHHLGFKMGEPVACAVLLIGLRFRYGSPQADYAIAALLWSAIGDFFLSSRGGHPAFFVYGIGAFFVAHLGYLAFALKNGRLHGVTLGILLALYLPFFWFFLRPAIKDSVLLAAVLAYLLVSCVSLAAAAGLRLRPSAKTLYLAGIGLIVVSDTLIALGEFLRYRAGNGWILPTYYLAHLCVTLALFCWWPWGQRPNPVSGEGEFPQL